MNRAEVVAMLRRVLLVPLGWDLELRSVDGIAKELDRIEREQETLDAGRVDTCPECHGIGKPLRAGPVPGTFAACGTCGLVDNGPAYRKLQHAGRVESDTRRFMDAYAGSKPAPTDAERDLAQAMEALRPLMEVSDGDEIKRLRSLEDAVDALLAAYDAQRGRKGGTSE